MTDRGWREVDITIDEPTVSCIACGCALYRDPTQDSTAEWLHYGPVGSRDSAGCQLRCALLPHDRRGRPLRS
jgi:hypothetical protein